MGAEIGKDLILAGPGVVDIYDPEPGEMADLCSNFYLTENHIKNKIPRSEAILPQFKELNPYVIFSINFSKVKVNVVKELTETIALKYDVVVVTELWDTPEKLIAMNESLRAQGKGTIVVQNLGVSGWAFVDFGEKFTIFDKDGEQTKDFIVSQISNDGIITIHEDKRHSFEDGDCVVFRELRGMEHLNGFRPLPITVIDPFSFKINLEDEEKNKLFGNPLKQYKRY